MIKVVVNYANAPLIEQECETCGNVTTKQMPEKQIFYGIDNIFTSMDDDSGILWLELAGNTLTIQVSALHQVEQDGNALELVKRPDLT
jgi:hypothetical protein